MGPHDLFRRLGFELNAGALRSYCRYLHSSYRLLVGSAILLLIASCLRLSTPILTGFIIDRVLMQKNTRLLHLIGPLLFLLTAAYLSVTIVRTYIVAKVKWRLQLRLHQALLQKISRLSFTYVANKKSGYLVSRVHEDTQAAQDFVTNDLVTLLQQVFMFVSSVSVMATISWRMAIVSLLVIPIYIVAGSKLYPHLRDSSRRCLEALAQRQKTLYEIMAGMYTLNACGGESQMLRRFLNAQVKYIRADVAQFWLGARIGLERNFIAASGPLVVLWYGGVQVIDGKISIGELVAFSSIFSYVFDSAQSLSATHMSLQKFGVALERLHEILAGKEPVSPGGRKATLERIHHGIYVDHVGYSYNGNQDVLRELTMHIPAGKITALVGRSGAGKTTLAHLLMRFYHPNRGEIRIDHVPLNCLSTEWLRRKIVLVPQDVSLFSISVEDNIRLGDPDASREKVIEAAILANAHEFIQSLPNGYETALDERGVNLSGGQRQRIAIARALLRDPELLILDEAVSAVDGISEQIICETIKKLNHIKQITVIIIAHGRATVEQADNICLIEDGREVAEGSHQMLLAECPQYSELFNFRRKTTATGDD